MEAAHFDDEIISRDEFCVESIKIEATDDVPGNIEFIDASTASGEITQFHGERGNALADNDIDGIGESCDLVLD